MENIKKIVIDEGPDYTFQEKLRIALKSPRHLPVKILSAVDKMFVFFAANALGSLVYDRKYLKGKWFAHPWSPGWRWTWNDALAKVFLGTGRGIPWPVSSQGAFTTNVDFHVDDINNFQGPVYFQTYGNARIKLGKGVWIARGCAFITSNHDPENPDVHLEPKDIEVGDHCWLGTNVVVMPGVVLGPHTSVGANAVVTKSFPEGHCVLAGVPARMIRSF